MASKQQNGDRRRSTAAIELSNRGTTPDQRNIFPSRQNNDRAIIENPLDHFTDEQLQQDVAEFSRHHLPSVEAGKMLRAARVAKDIRVYDGVARGNASGADLPVQLTDEEKDALRAERDSILDKGMLIVILTVSLAAFLQGHVQSSINGGTLFPTAINLTNTTRPENTSANNDRPPGPTGDDWRLGAASASPFFFAALVGAPLSLPLNEFLGRKGAMAVAAILILSSSIASAFVHTWYHLFGVRVINGVGMGIKAVSTPILASETSIGFWRGTSILAWQLWVAFGIMMGLIFNMIFLEAEGDTSYSLMLGAPCVPAFALLVALYYCPESPRYYMSFKSPRHSPAKAYEVMKKLRKTELQALRDIYLVYKSVQQDDYGYLLRHGRLTSYVLQFKTLFERRRLRNALISTSTVGLAQQLCGTSLFLDGSNNNQEKDKKEDMRRALGYSVGFGAINFVFGLPAIRTIDTLGRRKWLTITLLPMAVFMGAAALVYRFEKNVYNKNVALVIFLYIFAALYSPGMGPIPFTLASESFPLSHREPGCAFTIMIYFLFAGGLSIGFPSMRAGIGLSSCMGLFAGLNVLAFILVFTFVEETKRRSLEDLDMVFDVPKSRLVVFNYGTYLPWFIRHYFLGDRSRPKPNYFVDRVWGKGGDVDYDDDTFRNPWDLPGALESPAHPGQVGDLEHGRPSIGSSSEGSSRA